jgi:hypothetical protein
MLARRTRVNRPAQDLRQRRWTARKCEQKKAGAHFYAHQVSHDSFVIIVLQPLPWDSVGALWPVGLPKHSFQIRLRCLAKIDNSALAKPNEDAHIDPNGLV